MRRVQVGQYEAVVDDSDFATVSRFVWSYHIGGYAYCQKLQILMHRFILGAQTDVHIDHRDGDGLNNQRQNLREATRSQNLHNRSKQRGKKGFKGVYFDRQTQRWRVKIMIERKYYHLGRFDSEHEAARVYDDFARSRLGPFARYNFPRAGEQSALV